MGGAQRGSAETQVSQVGGEEKAEGGSKVSTTSSASSGGLGLGSVLTCIFVTLKLCGVIHWSWWWVLAPMWIPILLVVVVLGVAVLIAGFSK